VSANFALVKRITLLLLLLPAAVGCSNAEPYATTVGVLHPGATMRVRVGDATVSAYAPAQGQPPNRFTVAATAAAGTPPPAPLIRLIAGGIEVDAPHKLATLLVRSPQGVNLVVDSARGDVNVTDIPGNARVTARHGNVTIMLNGYAQASVGKGNLDVMMGATDWPGTLRFTVQRGNVEVSVRQDAAFRVHLHTGDGTLFTDFDLLGSSQGNAETIDGTINGGKDRRIDVEVSKGSIRLLRLHPQA
jgi:hypothetical protein